MNSRIINLKESNAVLHNFVPFIRKGKRGFFIQKIQLVQKVVIYFENADKLRVINRKLKIIIHIFMNNF